MAHFFFCLLMFVPSVQRVTNLEDVFLRPSVSRPQKFSPTFLCGGWKGTLDRVEIM